MVPLGAPKAPSENRPANSSPPKAARQLLMRKEIQDGGSKMVDRNQDGGRGRGKGEGGKG